MWGDFYDGDHDHDHDHDHGRDHDHDHDRDYELDSLLNNIGSIVIFYENLVTKALYGLIIGTLITALVAFPLIFAGIHVWVPSGLVGNVL